MEKTLYLVGNAHLDPVWQWRWQEGSMEAKATIRSALDRMNEFPDFRFVCSSASVFQWVEDFAPEMFDEIKQRVSEGRFVIVGGWFVQPDCNLPGGEAFARQSLYSQRYFREKFGVTAKVGYNVDSFGHNAMLPQILKKSGMDYYVFMRPSPQEKEMESDVFKWIADDGSQVTAYRILDPYCFQFSELEKLESRISYLEANNKANTTALPVFYGVGNHGGGPTIRHLEVLHEYAEKHRERRLFYADLCDFFEETATCGIPIPEYRGDLQHHASGCYSTVPAVKIGIRRAETALIAAESYNTLAAHLCHRPYNNNTLAEAWKAVCFCHFHDSMDGCSIRSVYDDAADMLGFAKYIAAKEENSALQAVSWQINTRDRSKGQPLIVFNPHSFTVKQPVRINKDKITVKDSAGAPVLSQQVRSASLECHSRSDTLFVATVPAMGYAVYYTEPLQTDTAAEKVSSDVQAVPYAGLRTANTRRGTVLENDFLRIEFEEYSGFILSILNKRTNTECLADRGAIPVVVDEYYHDAWSHGKNFFSDEMARFSDASISVVESGPVRATVKVVNKYNSSVLTQYFSLTVGSDKLDVRASVDWHEKHKMLKIKWPMAVKKPQAFYEIPFGVIQRPADGEEEPGINWVAVKGSDNGFAIVNDGTYSSSVCGNTIYQTVLRSPIYGDHGGPRNQESEFTAQGRMDFSYTVMGVCTDWTEVVREGKVLNKGVTSIHETWHNGQLPADSWSGLQIDCPNVVVSALKRSEDDTGIILRVYETTGIGSLFHAQGPLLPKTLCAEIGSWSVNTYFLKDGSDKWEEVLMTELFV